jgi:hypothetical protein
LPPLFRHIYIYIYIYIYKIQIHAALAGDYPLSFAGTTGRDGPRVTIGVEEPAADRVLTLPDVSGTLLTTGRCVCV